MKRMTKYTWQCVTIDGGLFSTAEGLFDTKEQALAYWKMTPETAAWTSPLQDVVRVGYSRFHLTLIEWVG